MRLAAVFVLLFSSGHLHAQETADTLEHIRETGEMSIGYRVSRHPVSFADEAGLPTGYSVEICKLIAEDVREAVGQKDIEIKYVPVTAQDRFDAIENGNIDILCGATTKTLGRSERVGFTQLTLVTGGSFLSLDDKRIVSVGDLAGQSVAVTAGTTTEAALKAAVEEAAITAEIVSVSSPKDGLSALNAREVTAYASDQVVLIGQVLTQKDNDQNYFLSGDFFSFEPYALAIRRGDPDFALVADRTISRLFRSGQIQGIYEQSFGRFGLKPADALLTLYDLLATPE